jgi:hypothetical protein
MRRAQSTASATPTSTFFGSQPRNEQVPPNGLESICATDFPASRHADEICEAADPLPVTTTSKLSGITLW